MLLLFLPQQRHFQPPTCIRCWKPLTPAGGNNIITGNKEELAAVLANHDDVDGVWYTGSQAGCKAIDYAAAENMKRTG